jgi:uncharacterized protein DUF4031
VPVYVDDARIPYRGLRWSHLVADSAEELHRAAQTLGIAREHAQERGRTLHYDLPDAYRERAIELRVAEAISWRELARRRHALARSRNRGT